MPIFDNMTKNEIQIAQDKLNDLCKKHDVEQFDIQAKDGLVCWRNLVQSMCGIDVHHCEKSGRKGNPDELVNDVRRLYVLHTAFSPMHIYYDEKKEKGKQETIAGPAPAFSKRRVYELIAGNLSKKYGKKITPTKIRGILNNKHNADQIVELENKEQENLENDPCDPDEFFNDMQEN